MQSKLERKWWFYLPCGTAAIVITYYVALNAGLREPYNFAAWLMWACCSASIDRAISFLVWLLVACFSPPDKVLERTK